MLSHHFKHMAAYHRHATTLILQSIDKSINFESNEQLGNPYYQDLPCLFFGSIHGTLNHLLGAEQLWFHRLVANDSSFPTSIREFVSESSAREIGSIYNQSGPALRVSWKERIPVHAELKNQLLLQCDAWENLANECYTLGSERIMKTCLYRDTSGVESSVVLASALTQVFNHGTHHRGQITAALNSLTMAATGGTGGCDVVLDMQGMGEAFLSYGGVPK